MVGNIPRIGRQHTVRSLARLARVAAGQDLRFTDAALAEAAKRFSNDILQAWHGMIRGVDELDLDHFIVRLALAWLQGTSTKIAIVKATPTTNTA
ncbi:hypothetical protein HBI81_245470 [Parastagonospora nodorum]|nr:hypothetical protein HBH52_154140 [Parastagonospora nodorum]KAH4073621.1 hypothetical protein HBH50_056570 [Parastagonospora nodorum]KAH4207881.1 hypothetical protein HBI95_096670 [Parastagonospora nodorum]KAH4287175.1 hypothetical protein HBI01_232400 [Parastagonospora nodorum]KAH4320876.1 hypothetical protein HBI00_222310 [Parastagonospora nodorum]